jgi:hypothetical protein
MNETKHTPGPWMLYPTPILSGEIYQVFAPESKSRHWIANIQIDAGEDGDGQANANLIAAAPEMYEALQLAMAEIGASGNWMAKDYGWIKACTAIQSAIAKAEGK